MIENVAGFCPSRCIMCNIEESNRKGIMSNSFFEEILLKFFKYRNDLDYTTIQGLGEPLLDKNIAKKVEIAKKLGFPSVGFSTVAVNLDDDLAVSLIEAGLDTIIFSIDGATKMTHESIRIGTDYDVIFENVNNFIRRRNIFGKTKIIIRMIKQEKNQSEWDDYKKIWLSRLDQRFGDQIGFFMAHNGNSLNEKIFQKKVSELKLKKPLCREVYDRIIVYVDGSLGLCCADSGNWFDLGNVLHEDPIELYNKGWFFYYREKMEKAEIYNLPHCSKCSVLISAVQKIYIDA